MFIRVYPSLIYAEKISPARNSNCFTTQHYEMRTLRISNSENEKLRNSFAFRNVAVTVRDSSDQNKLQYNILSVFTEYVDIKAPIQLKSIKYFFSSN